MLTRTSTPSMLQRTAEYQLRASRPEMSRDSQLPSTQSSHRSVYRDLDSIV